MDLSKIEMSGEAPRKRDAIGSASSSAVLSSIEQLRSLSASARMQKMLPHLKKAVSAIRGSRWKDAATSALAALDIDEHNPMANHLAAISMENLGATALAIDFYERTIRLSPDDPDVMRNLGSLAWRLDMLEVAEKWLRIQLSKWPTDVEAMNDLAGIHRDASRFEDAIDVIRTAINLTPTNALLWNTLGTILTDQGNPSDALQFFAEALRIDHRFARVYHNRGNALLYTGDMVASLADFEQAAKLNTHPRDGAEIDFARGLVLLSFGRLKEAWPLYARRNDPVLGRSTRYHTPGCEHWDGQSSLEGRSIVLLAEQGVGDEILFLEAARDIGQAVGENGKLAIVSDERLRPLLERSFPKVLISGFRDGHLDGQMIRVAETLDWSRWDTFALQGDAFAAMRPSIEHFPRRHSFLTPDPKSVAKWRGVLAGLGDGPHVGVSWKSMMMIGKRQKAYMPRDAWRPILEVPNLTFVTVQYGDTKDDLRHFETEWGVRIHTVEGLNLKDDFDELAALLLALDVTLAPINATLNLAGAVGANAWAVSPMTTWAFFGEMPPPTYPSIKLMTAERFGGVDSAISAVVDGLKALGQGD
jgi:tetratricopeptide (TPR) repeat protein